MLWHLRGGLPLRPGSLPAAQALAATLAAIASRFRAACSGVRGLRGVCSLLICQTVPDFFRSARCFSSLSSFRFSRNPTPPQSSHSAQTGCHSPSPSQSADDETPPNPDSSPRIWPDWICPCPPHLPQVFMGQAPADLSALRLRVVSPPLLRPHLPVAGRFRAISPHSSAFPPLGTTGRCPTVAENGRPRRRLTACGSVHTKSNVHWHTHRRRKPSSPERLRFRPFRHTQHTGRRRPAESCG